jgi:creatinine amidohydrolase
MKDTARPRSHLLGDLTWKEVQATSYEVAVLPWGATEAHNYHLPYATDVFESAAIANEAGRIAAATGARVVVLPPIPFGVQTGQLDIPFCINMMPSTQALVLRDVVHSLESSRVRKLVVINGHGGNDFRQMIRELQPATPILLVMINWWQVVPGRDFFDEPGDHGGELETSVMLHIEPGLVRPLGEAGDGAERQPRIAGLRERWAWTPRPWTKVSADTGIGNPAAATAAKGSAYFSAVTKKIADFLVDLAGAETDELYCHPE